MLTRAQGLYDNLRILRNLVGQKGQILPSIELLYGWLHIEGNLSPAASVRDHTLSTYVAYLIIRTLIYKQRTMTADHS